MRSYEALPAGYREILAVDLQKNKRLALLVNGFAVVLMAALVGAALPFHSILTLFRIENLGLYILKFLVLFLGYAAYIVLHEAVHAVAMRHFSTAKVNFGFTGMYAYAGSDGYYCKSHYIIIALAPVVFWGIVLAIVNVLVPEDWFYVVYLIQVGNLSGAAGDFYVTWKMSRLPKDIVVRDSGVAMTVYSGAE